MGEEKLFGAVARNSTEQVQITRRTYKERTFLDIRFYYDDNGEWEPTRKGVTIAWDYKPEFLRILEREHGIDPFIPSARISHATSS